MSDTIYHGSLKIIVQKLIKGKREWTPESLGFGVDSFEVDGGADRKIEVSSGIDSFCISKPAANPTNFLNSQNRTKRIFLCFLRFLFGATKVISYDK
jgi:hypothetical protein